MAIMMFQMLVTITDSQRNNLFRTQKLKKNTTLHFWFVHFCWSFSIASENMNQTNIEIKEKVNILWAQYVYN